jgi:hypothetical protein
VRQKISAYLSDQVAERLAAAAKRERASRTAIIEAALGEYLEQGNDTSDSTTLLRRLNWMSRQLEQLDRDLRIVSETVALHARYHLTITPPLSPTDHRAACVLGSERFEVLAAQVGRRVHFGTSLMRETIDRLSISSPDLFAHEAEVGVQHCTQSIADTEAGARPPTELGTASELLAAVGEDGSNSGFPESDDTSLGFKEQGQPS